MVAPPFLLAQRLLRKVHFDTFALVPEREVRRSRSSTCSLSTPHDARWFGWEPSVTIDGRLPLRASGPSSTTTSATMQAVAVDDRAAAGSSAAWCAKPSPRPSTAAAAARQGQRVGAGSCGRRADDGRSRAGVGGDGSRPASRADRTRGSMRWARPLRTALRGSLYHFCIVSGPVVR